MSSVVEGLRRVSLLCERRGWLVPVALALAFCLNGIWWGSVEIWNADQMAFKDHFRADALPFSPETFDKPPLFTYMNFVFSVVPREAVARSASLLTGRDFDGQLDFISVWLAKLLQVILASASVYLVWRIAANIAEESAARSTALLLSTSAGFVVQAHLITTDLPVVFFMVLAFWACQRIHARGSLRDYVLAGMLVGLTGAIKYNGIVVGLALPVFHLFATAPRDLVSRVLDRRLYLGLACVPVGFLAGNPYAAVEFQRFANDLRYLFATSPQFLGASGENTRDASIVMSLATDHLGWPLFIVLIFAVPFSLFWVARNLKSRAAATVIASALIVAFYVLYFSLRTNLQVRWVLAIVPFVLIAMIPFWQSFRQSMPRIHKPVVLALVFYGAICSLVVGLRFSWDPRFEAIEWVRENVPPGSSIESSGYTPRWRLHVDHGLHAESMAFISGRNRIYEQAFAGNPALLAGVEIREHQDNVGWYSEAELSARNPDYVAVSSIYFDRFLHGTVADTYPEIRDYFTRLLAGEAGYQVAFDRYCCKVSPLLYPQDILFVDNRIVILQRARSAPAD